MADVRFDAFISYKHGDDDVLAARLRHGLHRFARPWNAMRAMRVYLDQSSQELTPELSDALDEKLLQARFLILLASRESAASPWCRQETQTWITEKSSDTLLLVLTDEHGAIEWDDDAQRFDPELTTALPPALLDAFDEEPLWLDMTWADSASRTESLDLRSPRFRDAVATLSSTIQGIPKDQLDGDDVREHQRFARIRRIAVISLIVLTIASLIGGALSWRFGQDSADQERTSRSRQLAAQATDTATSQLDLSMLLGIEAYRVENTPEALGSMVSGANRARDINRILHGHDRPLRSVAHDPDGSLIASVGVDGTLMVWDGTSLRQLDRVERGSSSEAPAELRSLVFSSTEPLLAAAGLDGTVQLWDVSTPDSVVAQPLPMSNLHQGESLLAVDISPDGSMLASVGGIEPDGRCGDEITHIVLTELGSGVERELGTARGCVLDVAFSPTERTVATAHSDGSLVVWSLDGPSVLHTVTAHDGRVASVDFAPDGTRLVSAGWDGVVKVWDASDPVEPSATFTGHSDIARAAVFSPDGTAVASGDRSGGIALWDATTAEELRPLSAGHAGEVRGLSFDPTGSELISAATDRSLISWTVRSGWPLATPLHGGTAQAVVYDEDRGVVVTAGRDLITRADGALAPGLLWTGVRGRDSVPTETGTEVYALALHGSAGLLASGENDGTISLWDPDSKTMLRRVEPRLEQCGPEFVPVRVRSLAFHPSSTMLAAGLDDGSILVIDAPLEAGSVVRCARGSGTVWDLTFSPDGRHLAASGGRSQIILWDVVSDVRRSVVAATEEVQSLAFDPSGTVLAIGGSDGDILLLDPETERSIGQALSGHERAVQTIAFDTSGTMLASGSSDATVRLWNVATRVALGDPLRAHPGRVFDLTWLAGDGGLATGGEDATYRWDLQPATLRRHVCRAANRNLSELEWESFVGSSRPWEPSCPDLESDRDDE